MTILLIDNVDSFTYNLYQQVQGLTGEPVQVVRNQEISWSQVLAIAPSRIIFSPGPGHPSVPSDVGICQTILDRYAELNCPILGVCLGHQLLAHHFGADILRAPMPVHGEVHEIQLVEESLLFGGWTESLPRGVMRYHSLLVDRGTLPSCLKITAETVLDGLVMGIEHREKPLFGIQFHPESIGTPWGNEILQGFLKIDAEGSSSQKPFADACL